MPATVHCPDCGFPVPADAPQGECPRCLLKAGFESEPAVAAASVAATRTSAGHAHFVAPSVADLQQRIPQYEILELIGQGGMGAVYKAKQAGLGRLVAIKILPVEVSQSAAFTERFSREARALALLSHPHIVTVHDFGQAADLCYFVMEYVDGVNLRQALQAGKMNPQQALAIVPQICDALQYAHEEGVVHRDIKPENILIDKRGRVKIADFGLAKLLGTDAPEHSLTGTQQVMGTLRYMAPEQMFGSKEVDHRADIFSLGVVFYELLTGELPVGRFAPPSKKSGVDVRLDEVVLRALESEPSERYQSVSEMKHGLDSISKLELPAVLPSQPPAQPLQLLLDETDTSIRLRQHCFLLTGFVLLIIGVTGFGWLGGVPAICLLGVAGGCYALANLDQQRWEVNCHGHRIAFVNGVMSGSHLLINGGWVARSGMGFRQELQGWLPDGSGRRIIAMTEAGFTRFRCQLFLQPAVPGVPVPPPRGSDSPQEWSAGTAPRLSRAAIWGAVFSPLFILGVCLLVLATIPAVVIQRVDENAPARAGVPFGFLILFGLVELGCLIAPFVTTLLGVIAIGNIRGSRGKVYGMPLALFDALLYPLLLLDLIVFAVGLLVFSLVGSLLVHLMVRTEGTVVVAAWMPVFLATVVFIGPLIVLLDIWLIRLAWRAATSGLASEQQAGKLSGVPPKEPSPFQPAESRKTTSALVIVLIVLGLLTIPVLLGCGVLGTYFLAPIGPRAEPKSEQSMSHEHEKQLTNPVLEKPTP